MGRGGIISYMYTGLHTLVKLQCRRGFYVDRRLRGITLLMGIFVSQVWNGITGIDHFTTKREVVVKRG